MIDANRSPLPHRFMRAEQRAVGVLQRQVEVGHDGRRLEHRRDERVADLARVEVEQPDPARGPTAPARRRGGAAAGRATPASPASRPYHARSWATSTSSDDAALDQVAATRRRSSPGVREPLLATERWDRAEGTGAVAALGDLHVGPGRGRPGPRQLEQVAHPDGLAPWRAQPAHRHGRNRPTSSRDRRPRQRSRRPRRPRAARPAAPAPDRSARQPVTTRRAPSRRTSASSRIVSTDSRRAASTNAQVFTTTRSASPAPAAGSRPSASSDADDLVGVDRVLRAAQGLDPEARDIPTRHGGHATGRPGDTLSRIGAPTLALRLGRPCPRDLVEIGEWPRLAAQILRARLETAGITVMARWSGAPGGP